MGQYKVVKTGELVEVSDEKNFTFPASGEKILTKTRPPVAKTAGTD